MASRLPPISVCFCVTSFFILLSKGTNEYIQTSKARECVHGETTANGKCACLPCWSGRHCELPRNRYPPKFSQEVYHTSVPDPTGRGSIFVPEVFDEDLISVCKHTDDCPCADVTFSILFGNEDGLFTIDPKSGALSISSGALPQKDRYEITVQASNQFYDNEPQSSVSTADVIVDFPFYQNQAENHHHIEKRAVSSVVGNVTFDLKKKYPYNDTTEMKVGSRVRFQLTITFPIDDTDMLVELFTPDNDTTVMILCDVNVTAVGSSLVFNGSKVPVMDSREPGSVMYDRAIINFGVVQNSGCLTAEECSIYIEYEAILLENPATTAGEVYWVSAGAEYNNENEVWVGQASFVAFPNDTTVTENPIANFTGPDTLSVGSAAVFQVDLYLPNPSSALSFDAFAPINTSSVMSICSTKLKFLSDNFKCGFDERAVSTQYNQDQTGIGNSMSHLTLGTLLNKGSRDATNVQENNRISVEFVAHLYNDPNFVGTNYMVGAAFEISPNEIWAGQMKVTATTEVDASGMTTPLLEFNPPSGQTVAMGDAVTLQLEIQIPVSTTTSYSLVIKAPFSTTAIFKVCSVEIISIGDNMPCVHKEDKKTVYSSRDLTSSSSEPDMATLDLGGITNLNLNNSAAASTIVFEVTIAPLNHTAAVDTSFHDVEVTLNYAGTSTVDQTSSIQILGTSVLTASVSNTTSPSFFMKYLFGNEYVEVGTATRAQLEITTNRSVSYPMMNMEFIVPLGNFSSKMSICRARMLSAGRNLPCVSPDWINSKVTYRSQYDSLNDQAFMYLSTVCNYERVDNVTDDVITIVMDVKVEDSPELITGEKEWITAGNQYSDTKMWVGQLALYGQRSGIVIPGTTPYINIIKNTTLSSVPVGYPSVYTALIKIAPQESAKLKVTVTLASPVLSICGLRIKDVGDNLPCVDKNVTTSFGGSSGFIDLGIVTNTGSDALVSNDFYDSNTILVEMLIQLADDTSAVTDGGSYGFSAEVEYASDGSKKSFPAQTMVATHDKAVNFTSVNNRTTNSFYLENIGTNDSDVNIAKGESKRFVLEMVFPEGEVQDVTVKFMTSLSSSHLNTAAVCGAGLTFVGENFPCLDKTTIKPVYTQRSGSTVVDTATIQLGFVRSSGVKSGDDEANTLRLEAVARLLPTSSLSAGTKIPFHVAVTTNNVEIYVSQIELTVTDTPTVTPTPTTILNTSLLYINSSSDPYPVGVGNITTLPIVLYVPPNTMSAAMFDIELPVLTVPIGTIEEIRIAASGSNLGCVFENDLLGLKYNRKFNSSLNTCKINHGQLDFGTIANSGLSQRAGAHSESDDVIQIEVDVRIDDNIPDSLGTEFPISIGAKVADYIVIYERNITLTRTGYERPDLELTASYNTALSTSTSTVIDAIFKHSNLTSATGVNATVYFYLPPYLKFKQVQSNGTHSNPEVTEGIVEIQFDQLSMCEVVNLQLTLEPNQTLTVPIDILTENTMVAYEANTYMTHTAASVYPADQYFDTPLRYLNFSSTVTKVGVCDQPLGMASGHIDDCQLDGSIENDPARPPSHGRYNGNSAWRPFSRGPTFSKYRYFQVFFGNKTLVNKIVMQKGSGYTHHPTQLSLKYSNDGYSWQTAETILVATPFTVTTLYPQRQTQARYMRVFIDRDDTINGEPPDIGLKFEFYGCYLSSEYSTTNICNAAPSNIYPNDFYFRSFHALTGKVLMCDINPQDRDLRQHCHFSTDGSSWTAMDGRVASLLGHESTENIFFAYGNDQRSTLMSKDEGNTWFNVPRDFYLDTRSKLTFTPSKNIPMQVTNLAVTEPHASYQFGSWGVTFEGLWKSSAGIWNKVVEWDVCC